MCIRAVACYFSDFCVNLLNIIYLVRELYLGDRIGSFSLLERWVVAALFVGRHFPSVLWPLAGDVRRITCSFIALALDIHVFCLRAEAEGAILDVSIKVWGKRSELNTSCGRVKASLLFEWVRSQKRRRLSPWRCKDWDGLHESSYCYLAIHLWI